MMISRPLEQSPRLATARLRSALVALATATVPVAIWATEEKLSAAVGLLTVSV